MAEPRTWAGRFYEGGNFLLLARVVRVDQQLIVSGDFDVNGGVTLKIYDTTDGLQTEVYSDTTIKATTPVGGGALASLTTVPASGTNTGYGWPDSAGFNLALLVKDTNWTTAPVGGRLYLVEAAVNPNLELNSGLIYVTWRLRCLPVKS